VSVIFPDAGVKVDASHVYVDCLCRFGHLVKIAEGRRKVPTRLCESLKQLAGKLLLLNAC
jgi:hypothetical protein